METKHSTSAFTTNHMASENVVGAIVVDHSSRQFSPVFQRFDFMLYLSVYDCYSALCLKVTKTLRTSVCTMYNVNVFTGWAETPSVTRGFQSVRSHSDSVLGPDSDRGLALR